MTKNQSAAYLFSQSACALAEIEGMKAENAIRGMRGEPLAYNEAAFIAVIDNYGIHHNGAVALLNEATED
jgi:hypothetical protein